GIFSLDACFGCSRVVQDLVKLISSSSGLSASSLGLELCHSEIELTTFVRTKIRDGNENFQCEDVNNMKGLATFALLVATATAAAVGNMTFSCPDQTWGGCCAEEDDNGGGHTCHDASSVGSGNEYICSNKTEYSKYCPFALWVVSTSCGPKTMFEDESVVSGSRLKMES
ncbi:hypothetical protein DL98DRAFT_623889, partial [Cadophora sp. DSE1049]